MKELKLIGIARAVYAKFLFTLKCRLFGNRYEQNNHNTASKA